MSESGMFSDSEEKPLYHWIIRELTTHLAPSFLEVLDDSDRHAGHREVKDGHTETHFHLRIASDKLRGQSRVQQHRCIYRILKMSTHPIHALSITVLEEKP